MEILKKLERQLLAGVKTEAEVLYVLAEARKFLEQHELKQDYSYLVFHCDWGVHAKLQGPMAQQILTAFDKANVHLKAGLSLQDLPSDLRREVDRLSKLRYFEKELLAFLTKHNLPALGEWTHFLHLYAQIVEHCPLIIAPQNTAASIENVTIHFELANRPIGDQILYKITWEVLDKNGKTGSLFIINSFTDESLSVPN
jgi:hypothetical protein